MAVKRKHYAKSVPASINPDWWNKVTAHVFEHIVKEGKEHTVFGIKYRWHNITYDEYREIQGMPPRLSKRLK